MPWENGLKSVTRWKYNTICSGQSGFILINDLFHRIGVVCWKLGVSGETCSADSKAAGVWESPGPKRLTHRRPSQVGGSCKDWKYGLTGKLKILGLLYHPFFCAHPIKMLRQNKPGSGLNGHGVKLKTFQFIFIYPCLTYVTELFILLFSFI